MKTKVLEVITYKKQTSKTKYKIEAALEYRPPLNITRNFFSEKNSKLEFPHACSWKFHAINSPCLA